MNPTRRCATYNIMTYFNIRNHLRIDMFKIVVIKSAEIKSLSWRPAIVFEQKKEQQHILQLLYRTMNPSQSTSLDGSHRLAKQLPTFCQLTARTSCPHRVLLDTHSMHKCPYTAMT